MAYTRHLLNVGLMLATVYDAEPALKLYIGWKLFLHVETDRKKWVALQMKY